MFESLRKKILNYGVVALLAMSAGCESYNEQEYRLAMSAWHNYQNETQPEVFRLPNGVSIRKKFIGDSYKVNERGEIILSKDSGPIGGYQNPKISVSTGGGNYLIIPQNANWDQIVKGLKIYSDGRREFIEADEIKRAIESGNKVYPVPADAYGEDRSGLERILSEAKKLGGEGKLEESLKMQKNAITQYDSPILQYNIGILNLKLGRNDLGKIDNVIEDLGKVFSKDPDVETMAAAHTSLGIVYLIKGGLVRTQKQKWFNRAEVEFQKALAIKPDDESAKNHAGIEFLETYHFAHDYESADEKIARKMAETKLLSQSKLGQNYSHGRTSSSYYSGYDYMTTSEMDDYGNVTND